MPNQAQRGGLCQLQLPTMEPDRHCTSPTTCQGVGSAHLPKQRPVPGPVEPAERGLAAESETAVGFDAVPCVILLGPKSGSATLDQGCLGLKTLDKALTLAPLPDGDT
ncbi:hypothetical protein BDW68DRAFT_183650 [Aspergillus falconensis]